MCVVEYYIVEELFLKGNCVRYKKHLVVGFISELTVMFVQKNTMLALPS